jgi:hypothetical protein
VNQILGYIETLGEYEKCKYCPFNLSCTKTATRKNNGEIMFPQCIIGDIKLLNSNIVNNFKTKFEAEEIELSSIEDFLEIFFDEFCVLIFEFLEAFNKSLFSIFLNECLKLFIGLLNNFNFDKYKSMVS